MSRPSIKLLTICGLALTLGAQASALDESVKNNVNVMLARKQVSQAAFDELSAALKAHPNDPDAHILLWKCYDEVGMPAMAHDEFMIASKLRPQILKELLAEFKQILQKGDAADGFKPWLELRTIFPNDEDVKQYGDVIRETFQTLEGAESMELAERKHGHKLAGVDAAYSNIRYRQHRYADAIRLAQYDLNMHPDIYGAAVTKAAALNAIGKHSEAALTVMGMYKTNPFIVGVAREYAKGLLARGKYEQAMLPAMYNLAVMTGIDQADARALQIAHDACAHTPPKTVADVVSSVSKAVDGTVYAPNFHWGLTKLYLLLDENSKAFEEAQKLPAYGTLTAAKYLTIADAAGRVGKMDLEVKCLDLAARTGDVNDKAKAMIQLARAANRDNDLALRMKRALKTTKVN